MKVKLFILVFILLFLTGCTHNVNHNNFTEFSTLTVKPTMVPTVPPGITEVPMILPEVTLNVSVVYRPITVSGLQMVWFEEGKGVELEELLETLEMYREPDLDSAKFSVSPQMVMALATSPDWVQLRLNDETEAWIYVEFIPGKGCIVNQEKTADILFDGFSNAG